MPAPKQAHGKRLDIQGLRAIAVLAVIADHLLHWPSGGFVGVDVFFVISGFLITGLLLREHDRTGKISFAGFYKRRVRRIMPAAVTVLAVTTAATFVVFNTGRAQQTAVDALWSLFFSANWHFAAIGTDYFQASGPVSPFQHFWSLAVEEQFYFVWPAVMAIIFWLTSRSTMAMSHVRMVVVGALAAIVVLSFVWASWESVANPTVAYFSTFSRAWELGVGALLALVAPLLSRIPPALRPVLGWVGLAGIVWSLFAVSASVAFPAPWGAAPVLSAALFIAAGTGGRQRFMWPLTSKASVYVGEISYSLYLWHFPCIVLMASVIYPSDILYVPLVLLVTLATAAMAYHLVEKPVLNSTWLDDSPSADRRRRERRDRGFVVGPRLKYGGLAVLAVATALVTTLALVQSQAVAVPRATQPLANSEIKGAVGPAVSPELDARTKVLTSALSATTWPDLSPDPGTLAKNGRASVPCEYSISDPIPGDDNVLDRCVQGAKDGAKTALVLGDSFSAAFTPSVVSALEPAGWGIISLTKSSCPAIQIPVKVAGGASYPACTAFQAWVADQVKKLRPDMVVVMSWQGHVRDRLASGATGNAALSEWQSALKSSVQNYASSGAEVVVISPPPGGANLQECYTPLSKPGDCVGAPSDQYKAFASAEAAAVSQLGANNPRYVSTQDWFCVQSSCPPIVGSTPVYVDGGHLTTAAAQQLGPVLHSVLLPAPSAMPATLGGAG